MKAPVVPRWLRITSVFGMLLGSLLLAHAAAAKPKVCVERDLAASAGNHKKAEQLRAPCLKAMQEAGGKPSVDQAACSRAQAAINRGDLTSPQSRNDRKFCLKTGGKLEPRKGPSGSAGQAPPQHTTTRPPSGQPQQGVDRISCHYAQSYINRGFGAHPAARAATQRCLQTGGQLQPPPHAGVPTGYGAPAGRTPLPPACRQAREAIDRGYPAQSVFQLTQLCQRQGGAVPPRTMAPPPAAAPAPAPAAAPAPAPAAAPAPAPAATPAPAAPAPAAPAPPPGSSVAADGSNAVDWPSELPSVNDVKLTISGSNPVDTLARQQATFAILKDYIAARKRQTGVDSPLVSRRAKEYKNERASYTKAAPGHTMYSKHRRSVAFREQTLARFIGQESIVAYRATPEYARVKAEDPDQKQAAR